jgi:prepilin-type processing-associated H-X9-DG protein
VNQRYRGTIVRGGADANGVWQGGKTKMATLKDGTSNTFVIGEKQLHPKRYESGDWHDDAGWADGWDPDVVRYTGIQPNPDQRYDNQGGWEGYRFGSAHNVGMNVLLGDGSVRFMSFNIDITLFNNLAIVDDGVPVPDEY